jgi:hypothetical protein
LKRKGVTVIKEIKTDKKDLKIKTIKEEAQGYAGKSTSPPESNPSTPVYLYQLLSFFYPFDHRYAFNPRSSARIRGRSSLSAV